MIREGKAADEAAIIDRISREFGVGEGVAAGDVKEFLAALVQHRLIETTIAVLEL